MKTSKALKHLFIPHEHNDYKPHFFRELSILILIAITLFLLGFSAGSSFFINRTVSGADVTASILIDLTNESRLAFNQPPLRREQLLDTAASLKAEDMRQGEYFAHNSPSGITPWHWFRKVGYDFVYAGENLAINFTEADQVRDAWLRSPTHRANLLDAKFHEIGMATLGGTYKGSPTIYIVQMFGTKAKALSYQAEPQDIVKDTSSTTEKVAISSQTEPEIKGQNSAGTESIREIISTPGLAIAVNEQAEAVDMQGGPVPTYSAWYERLLFGSSYYVDLAYKTLLVVVAIALLVMVMIEIRKQHWRHVAYGLGVLLIISLSIIINQLFW